MHIEEKKGTGENIIHVYSDIEASVQNRKLPHIKLSEQYCHSISHHILVQTPDFSFVSNLSLIEPCSFFQLVVYIVHINDKFVFSVKY